MDELKKLLENAGLEEARDEGEYPHDNDTNIAEILKYFDKNGKLQDGYIAKIKTDQGDEWVTRIYILPKQKTGRDEFGKHQLGDQYYQVNNWKMSNLDFRNMRVYKMEQVV